MSLYYIVVDWYGKGHRITAKQLYKRVMSDSKAGIYDWITSATKLVEVCKKTSFPQKYAQEIKIAILDCFAILEVIKKLHDVCQEDIDDDAVYFCYNSLAKTRSEKAKIARHNYLKAFIEGIAYHHFRPLEFNHYGPTYNMICRKWKKANFEYYSSKSELDFRRLNEELHEDFDKIMKKAEKEGAFQKDDEEYGERKYWASLHGWGDI